jgi:hypothetical protein
VSTPEIETVRRFPGGKFGFDPGGRPATPASINAGIAPAVPFLVEFDAGDVHRLLHFCALPAIKAAKISARSVAALPEKNLTLRQLDGALLQATCSA